MSEYTCENCLGKFNTGWSDEEASMEFNQKFTNSDIRTAALVCDDCYKELVPAPTDGGSYPVTPQEETPHAK